MGGTQRFILASAVAAAIVLSLAGCSGAGSAPTLPNVQADGEIIGAEAAAPTPTPTPTPQYSMNAHWIDTAGCPPELFAGMSAGLGTGGAAIQTTPSTSSGPTSLPALTSRFVPSCSFTFTSTAANARGLVGRGEIFIGMGQNYNILFTTGVLKAGFHKVSTVGRVTSYRRGRSVIGLSYIPPNTDGELYSVVTVLGVN